MSSNTTARLQSQMTAGLTITRNDLITSYGSAGLVDESSDRFLKLRLRLDLFFDRPCECPFCVLGRPCGDVLNLSKPISAFVKSRTRYEKASVTKLTRGQRFQLAVNRFIFKLITGQPVDLVEVACCILFKYITCTYYAVVWLCHDALLKSNIALGKWTVLTVHSPLDGYLAL